jgi:DNA invertase Pin-like site-specific DNA recombinase
VVIHATKPIALQTTGAEENRTTGNLLNTPMLIGYARVSTHEQTLNLQQDALTKAGCSKTFTDTASGAKAERKGLDEALDYVRKGDTLVVWRLDRLGRSLPHLITTMTGLEERGIGFKSLTENIDTTTSGGKLIFHIFGALAEFERNLIRERTTAGLTAARTRGRLGGRPKALTGKKLSIAQDLYDRRHPIQEILQTLKISRATLYRALKSGDRG